MNYQIVTDEQALKEFIDWLPECGESEQYYISLFARSKYCGDIRHIKSDKAQLKRLTSTKDRIFQKLKQMECEVGYYSQKNNIVPQEALACYITINPRDLWKASFNSLVALSQRIQFNNTSMNPHQEVMSEIQKSKGNTKYVTFDVDDKTKDIDLLLKFIDRQLNRDAVTIIESRGGFHTLVEPLKVDPKYKNTWYKGMAAHPLVDQKGDMMSPIVGTYQGGFTPKFVNLQAL